MYKWAMSEQNYKFGTFVFDAKRKILLKQGLPVLVGQKCLVLLESLLAAEGRAVSKSELMDAAWSTQNVEESNLAVQIAALRRCLGRSKSGGEWIATVQRVGYQFVNPDNLPEASTISAIKGGEVAILPFENMSGDPEQTYFSDGITNDIIAELSKYPELLVIARNSSFQFRGKSVDVRSVGRKLGVQYVVEGSVRRAGNQIRVTAQLIEVETSTHVWAEKYDRDLQDIFAIQDEITQMVTSRLSRQLKEAIAHRARNRPTKNFSAYEAFLQAQQLTGRYDTQLLAKEFAQRAIELDSGFAAARAILSFTACHESFIDGDNEHLVRALELAQEAIAQDHSEPLTHAAAGFAYMNLRRYREARTHLDEALSLNPNDTLIMGLRALLNAYTRRYEEALSEIDEALRRDPYAADWFWDVKGTTLMASGKPGEALVSFEKMKYVPQWVFAHQIVCLMELENLMEAVAIYRRLRNDHSHWKNGKWLSDPATIFSSFEYQDDIDRFVAAMRTAATAGE
jgi:TolB-like protein